MVSPYVYQVYDEKSTSRLRNEVMTESEFIEKQSNMPRQVEPASYKSSSALSRVDSGPQIEINQQQLVKQHSANYDHDHESEDEETNLVDQSSLSCHMESPMP
jgi:hypothetical protein